MARIRRPFDPATIGSATSIAVIGLGRFGTALALELMAHGTEVLGIDDRADAVQALNGRDLDGRSLKVEISKPKTSGGGGGGRGGFGGGGGNWR